ncbi:MAG: RNA-binding transcriptional accessory protein [Firmicutes bacterium]|nr:RNA-binding transcriptional accessory protein [Bacillota bacterium]
MTQDKDISTLDSVTPSIDTVAVPYTPLDIKLQLSQEFNLKLEYSANIVDLIADGNTIPFIARYRKEMHGDCGDETLRDFADRLAYLESLEKRKEEVMSSIVGQGKWTDEISQALTNAKTMTEVEDIYRPYKQKKKTRASVAIEKGLQPLADIMLLQALQQGSVLDIAQPFVNPESVVDTVQDAINGAKDIIAEIISDDANCRKQLRDLYQSIAKIKATLLEVDEKLKEKALVYETYKDYEQNIKDCPSHRILALNRGEKEDCIKVDIVIDKEPCIDILNKEYLKSSIFDSEIADAIRDSYDRLISPSIERETRTDLADKASEQAIKMFEVNLRPLLMQPPLKDKTILGLDPGYRTGCKVAVIDKTGNIIDHGVIYVTMSDAKKQEAHETLLKFVQKHGVDVISIGNGTASKETEIFVADFIKDTNLPLNYIIVNEAGASVYSASKLGTEEMPDYDVTIRGAASIARRLLDPLAELIKIDVKSIGVGQYQHDMPQKRLTEVLTGVVESCVNQVGVDLNTASYSLLSYVAGLNTTIAKNIVKVREVKPFNSREELIKVPKLGPKAYQQCAGFLRITDSGNILDNTAVHPESYQAANALLKLLGLESSVDGIKDIKDKTKAYGIDKAAIECGVGVPTLLDIVEELARPGRDVRDSLPQPILRADLMKLEDLQVDAELVGVVRNVIDFGVFVDIGVHHDGLVHLSQLADHYIKHPSEVLKVGDVVKVRVLEVDLVKKRIALTMRTKGLAKPVAKSAEQREQERQQKEQNRQQRLVKEESSNQTRHNRQFSNGRPSNNNTSQNTQSQSSVQDLLKQLQNKYKK